MINLDKTCNPLKCCCCVHEERCLDNNIKLSFELACKKEIEIRLLTGQYTPIQRYEMEEILKGYENGWLRERGTKEKEMMVVSIKTVDVEKEKEAAREEGYKQGLEEAWEIARRIELCLPTCGYTHSQLMAIFNSPSPNEILEKFSIHEVKEKIAAYEAEQSKPKLGDVVIFKNGILAGPLPIGIYFGEDSSDYIVLNKCMSKVKYGKSSWTIEKTGKHFDIQSMLDEIG